MQAKSDIKWEFIPVAFNYLRSENGNYTAEIPGIGITKRDMDTTSTTLTLEIKKFEEGWRITEAAFAYDVHGTIQKTQIMSLYSVGNTLHVLNISLTRIKLASSVSGFHVCKNTQCPDNEQPSYSSSRMLRILSLEFSPKFVRNQK